MEGVPLLTLLLHFLLFTPLLPSPPLPFPSISMSSFIKYLTWRSILSSLLVSCVSLVTIVPSHWELLPYIGQLGLSKGPGRFWRTDRATRYVSKLQTFRKQSASVFCHSHLRGVEWKTLLTWKDSEGIVNVHHSNSKAMVRFTLKLLHMLHICIGCPLAMKLWEKHHGEWPDPIGLGMWISAKVCNLGSNEDEDLSAFEISLNVGLLYCQSGAPFGCLVWKEYCKLKEIQRWSPWQGKTWCCWLKPGTLAWG